MPRPHSGDDFNEIEQQRCIIEKMDEEAVNDRFEEMLVSSTKLYKSKFTLIQITINIQTDHEKKIS